MEQGETKTGDPQPPPDDREDHSFAHRSRGPIQFLSAAWLVTVAVLLAFVWSAYDSYRRFEATAQQSVKIQELRGRIIYLDEVLTMSARMAVATGDAAWESRYRRFEPELDAAITEAETLVPNGQSTEKTDAANVALVELENQAFDLLRQGQLAESRDILSSAEYAAQKTIYAAGMQELGRQLEEVVGSALRSQQKRTVYRLVGGLVAIALLLVGWVVVLRVVHQWRRDLTRKHDQLLDELAWRKVAEEELRQHRDHLDELVKIRTAELSAANQKMKRDLEAAAKVQQSLLPRTVPDVTDARFAWHYRPCDELAGDILNVFQLDPTHIAIYVADVSGHGVAASLLSVAISRMLTPDTSAASLVVKPTDDPARPHIVPPLEVATELNRRFPMQDSGNKYFTLVYGVVDLETREFTYVSAGHPPVVRQAPGREPQVIRLDGMAIGWLPEPDFEQITITLDQGERLCIYSDGVPEAMDPEYKQFGNQRLMDSLMETRAFSLNDGVTRLVSQIERWCGDSGPKDDVSVVAFEIVG
jgi:sigma-B regulation protein RsbU (phosphoserine phosphatase)